jgi:electron transfer flavoprotein alpha subunit
MSIVLVFVETDDSGISEVSRETLRFARALGGDLHAVAVEAVGGQALAHLGEAGVVTVHQATGDRFSAYGGSAWAGAVVAAARVSEAAAVLAAGTARGMEIAAHAAVRLGVSMAANVTSLASTTPLVVNRQVVGGAALEQMALSDPIAVLTVAGHAVEISPADVATTPVVAPFSPEVSDADLRTCVVRSVDAGPDQTGALKSAKVVVSGGRGVGGPDGFGELIALADRLGGVLGVSRVVTSLGWRPHHEQVGQTGSRISPDLYLPCGISGAIQHWAGCSSSKTILAVNTDEDAPMVTKAHYAVIGDLHEVIPAVNEEIASRRG